MTTTLLKLIGHKFDSRFTWGEFYFGGKDLSLKWTDHGGDDQGVFILCIPFLFKLYLHTGYCKSRSCGEDRQYGFYYFDGSFVLCFGKRLKHIDMPWTYAWESTELLDFNFNRVTYETKNTPRIDWKEQERIRKEHSQTFDYAYTLKSGEVQHRKATVYVDRMTWHMRGWPWKKMVRTCICVNFDKEVGEETGSWKGGCTGCGYNMLPSETPKQCLRRMESERKF